MVLFRNLSSLQVKIAEEWLSSIESWYRSTAMLTELIHLLRVQMANIEELQTSQEPIKIFNFRQVPKQITQTLEKSHPLCQNDMNKRVNRISELLVKSFKKIRSNERTGTRKYGTTS